jgi:uncharacterized protein (DUF1778 family)
MARSAPRRGASRLEMRLGEDLKKLIEEAAAVTGESVSDFVRTAAEERANQVLFDARWTLLPVAYFDELVKSLDDPPEDWPELRAALRSLNESVEIR